MFLIRRETIAIPANEKDQAGFIVGDNIEARAVGYLTLTNISTVPVIKRKYNKCFFDNSEIYVIIT